MSWDGSWGKLQLLHIPPKSNKSFVEHLCRNVCDFIKIHEEILSTLFLVFWFFKDFIHLFLEGKREGESGKHQCVVASCTTPYWGPGPQPKNVP